MATWPTIIDDDGSGTTGTVLNDALFDQIQAYIDQGGPPGYVTVANGGSNIFDVALPTPRPVYYVRVYATTAEITIRSITGAPRVGDLVLVHNLGTFTVWCSHLGGSGAARLSNRVTSGATPLGPGGAALYTLDNVWMLAEHDQGKAIHVPYSASNYVGVGGGTWTVTSGQALVHDYFLKGNVVTVMLNLQSTTIAGTVSEVRIGGVPFTAAGNQGYMPLLAGGVLRCYPNGVLFSAFDINFAAIPAGSFTVSGQLVAMVT